MIEGVLHRYAQAGALSVDELLASGMRFLDWVRSEFEPLRILVEWPVSAVVDNVQRMEGWIDVLIETEAGWVIVDHKAYPGPRAQWRRVALGYGGQLEAYRCAVT